MKLLVVIPSWNAADMIGECLASLRKQTAEHDVVVVDNGSVDESVAIIERDFPDVHLIKLPRNTGFSGGVNTGITYGLKHDYDAIALFNNDATADKDWLKHLAAELEAYPHVGIAACKLLRLDGKHFDSTGQEYSIWGATFPRGRNQVDKGQFDTSSSVFGATGGATLYRSSMFREIGIFDHRYFAYYEDDDISFRARLNGWDIHYVPAARAYHHVGATSSKLGSFVRYHTTKNIAMTYIKNMPGLLFWLYLPLFLLWMLRLAISNTLRGHGWAYCQGIGRLLLNMPGLLRDRWRIQRQRKVPVSLIAKLLYKHLPPKIPTL